MADTLITNLANVASPTGAEELPVNVPGSPDTDGKVVLSALAAYVEGTLGNASGLDVGTTSGTVAAGDDSRFTDARPPTAHAASHVNGTDDIQDATASQKGLATAAQITKLDGIKAGSDVTGPASATDNALARFDGTTGKVVQNSAATLTDTGTLTVAAEGAQVTAEGAGGDVLLDASAGVSALIWRFDPGDGQKEVRLTVNESTSEDFTLKLPAAAGTVGQSLSIGSVSAPEVTLEWSTPAGGDALTTNPLSQFAATTSDQLRGVISDETGSGALVFANSPTLVTPALGTPSSGTLANCSGLPVAGLASFVGLPWDMCVALSDETTDLTTGLKVSFYAPYALTLTGFLGSVTTAGTGSTVVMDVHVAGTTVMSTDKISIDASELNSTTAATAPAITTTSVAQYALVECYIDQIGATIAGAGAKIHIYATRA